MRNKDLIRTARWSDTAQSISSSLSDGDSVARYLYVNLELIIPLLFSSSWYGQSLVISKSRHSLLSPFGYRDLTRSVLGSSICMVLCLSLRHNVIVFSIRPTPVLATSDTKDPERGDSLILKRVKNPMWWMNWGQVDSK